jgi:hypothetical protein
MPVVLQTLIIGQLRAAGPLPWQDWLTPGPDGLVLGLYAVGTVLLIFAMPRVLSGGPVTETASRSSLP